MSSRFVRNSFFGTVAAASSTLASFLSGLIVARTIGLNGTGSYALAVWIVAVTTTLTGAGLPATLTRYLPDLADDPDRSRADRLAAFVLRPLFAFSTLPLLVAGGYAAWLAAHPSSTTATASILADPLTCVLIGLCCTAQALGDFVKAYLRGMHQLDRVAKLTTAGALAQLASIAVGGLVFGVRGALLGYLIGAILPAVPLRRFWGIAPAAEPAMRQRMLKYTKFRWASEIAAAFVFARIEVFFLQMFWGVDSVGLLTASLTLANVAVQGPMMLTWGFLPHFAEHVSRNDRESLRRSYEAGTRILGFMIFPACFGLAAIIPELLPRLYGTAFAGAVPSAMLLVCAASVGAVAMVGSNLIWAMERTDVDLYLGSIGAILSTAGGFFLIAPMGVMGAAISRAVTQCVVIGLGLWFLTARLGFQVPFQALGRLLAASLLCAGAAHGCLLLIHGLPGLVVAIPTGAVVYLAGVRVFGGLEADDVAKLKKLLHVLPLPEGGVAQRLMLMALR